MAVVTIAFFVATKPEKKMMAQCYCLLFLKHKEKGDGRSYHCLFLLCNTTIEEYDDVLPLFSSSFQA
jgi:hypothetical protein